eukprot:9935-Heterococcus_DN1.PRE.5
MKYITQCIAEVYIVQSAPLTASLATSTTDRLRLTGTTPSLLLLLLLPLSGVTTAPRPPGENAPLAGIDDRPLCGGVLTTLLLSAAADHNWHAGHTWRVVASSCCCDVSATAVHATAAASLDHIAASA